MLLLEAGPRDRKLHVRVPAAFSKLFRSPLDWGYDTVPQAALDGRTGRLPARQGARRLGVDQRDDGDPRPSRRPRRVAGRLELGRRRRRRTRGAMRTFPRAAQREPEPAHARLPRVGGRRRASRVRRTSTRADNEGVGLTPVSIRRGRRYSVVDGYLRPALHRPNLTVVTGARATRLLVERGRARGVAYLLRERRTRRRRTPTARSCSPPGAIDTPRLLLLSGIGPAEELDRHGIPVVPVSPGVGRNLRDHLANGVLAAVDAETLYTAERLRHLLAWLVAGRGPAHLERRRGRGVRPGRSGRAGARPRADLRPGAVRGGGDGPALAGRRHRRRRAAPAAERRRSAALVGRPARRAGDRPALPHRPGRAATPGRSARASVSRAGCSPTSRSRAT